jgi:integrase
MGRLGPWATGTDNKKLAKAMESMLHEFALLGQHELIAFVTTGQVRLPELYSAKLEGRLEQLQKQAKDPPLRDVINRVHAHIRDTRVRQGLEQLSDMAPARVRLTWLFDPKHVTDILARAVAEGRKPNSVKRSLYRAISDLLTHEIGKSRRMAILTEVKIPSENDTRDVNLSSDQIQRLLAACDVDFRPLVALVLLTGIDMSPVLNALVQDFEPDSGTLWVRDGKATSRRRQLELSSAAQDLILTAIMDKTPENLIFGFTYHMLRYRWETVRIKAGLPKLRFKDLRHVFAGHWVKGGGPLKDLGRVLGHTVDSTTLRYTAVQASQFRQRMDTVAESMGITTRAKGNDSNEAV